MGISAAESLVHIAVAGAISTAMLGIGLRGRSPRDAPTLDRQRRWPWLIGGVIGAVMTIVVALADDLQPWDVGRGLRGFVAMLAAVLVAVTIGIRLLRAGLRGRRVGDHPFCRACGFDLFGRPANSNLCPECGATLESSNIQSDSIVIGTRERRTAPLLAGLFLLVVSLAIAAPAGRILFTRVRHIDWTFLMPESWLLDGMTPHRWDWRADELTRRSRAGTLSVASTRTYIDLLLTPLKPGDPANLQVVDNFTALSLAKKGWETGTLDEAVVRHALRGALSFRLDVAAKAERDRTLRYTITPLFWLLKYINSGVGGRLTLEIREPRVALADMEVPPEARRWTTSQADARSADAGSNNLGNALALTRLPHSLPTGPTTFNTQFVATFTLSAPGRPTLAESVPIALSGTTTIVEPGTLRCSPVRDAAIDAALPIDDPANVAAIARAPLADPDPAPEVYVRDEENGTHTLVLLGTSRGAILGDATLRCGGVDRSLGPVFVEMLGHADVPLDVAPSGPYDVLIRPMPELGAELFEQPPTFQKLIVIHAPTP